MEGHGYTLHNNTGTCLHASGEEYIYAVCGIMFYGHKILFKKSPALP